MRRAILRLRRRLSRVLSWISACRETLRWHYLHSTAGASSAPAALEPHKAAEFSSATKVFLQAGRSRFAVSSRPYTNEGRNHGRQRDRFIRTVVRQEKRGKTIHFRNCSRLRAHRPIGRGRDRGAVFPRQRIAAAMDWTDRLDLFAGIRFASRFPGPQPRPAALRRLGHAGHDSSERQNRRANREYVSPI
ncbi:MAG: hypothetical protein BWZ10_03103 [candidate division BRC1 bacterium ADurb.BinA364]|nr:MAG: hypothetical protein BWZ10_03103 [candidate division BRC1 bacterium ADurb.BinA364]